MNLKLLKNTDINNKIVLFRAPYDIGVKEKNGEYILKDDSRITATIPTLKYLIEHNCKIVILTWVERPNGIEEKYRTTPHAKALSKLLDREVKKVDDCIGEQVKQDIDSLKPGELLMLENTRFYEEEFEDNDDFAKKLCNGCEIVVFDGFPQAARKHASTTGILRHLPGVAGFYFEKEVNSLQKIVEKPEEPLTIIVGGAKVSDKVDAINNLLPLANYIIVGGGTANVFMKALGKDMGNSYLEDNFVDSSKNVKKDWVEYAKEIMSKEKEKIILPVDFLVADERDNPTKVETVDVTDSNTLVPKDMLALDIGPKSIHKFSEIIKQSKTVFWNGPMGYFENETFSKGTEHISNEIEKVTGTTIISGGDTIAAVIKYCNTENITHMSLAGGATLSFLAGEELPVISALIE